MCVYIYVYIHTLYLLISIELHLKLQYPHCINKYNEYTCKSFFLNMLLEAATSFVLNGHHWN